MFESGRTIKTIDGAPKEHLLLNGHKSSPCSASAPERTNIDLPRKL
jgi:hypothetical protein